MTIKRIHIDWKRLALNLRLEMPLAQASRKIGRHDSYVAQLSRGTIEEPFFGDGLALLDLHLAECGEEKHRALIRG